MAQEWEGEEDSSTIITVDDRDNKEEEAGGGWFWVWRAWTIPLLARMSSTCESITGETEGSMGVIGLTTSEGMRVESGDGEADHITADMTARATS